MTGINELIIYRNLENGDLLHEMVWIMENYKKEECLPEVRTKFFACINPGIYS